jgi:hypothetical protein
MRSLILGLTAALMLAGSAGAKDACRDEHGHFARCAPAGATALCRDGTYSFSQHRSGTCSHHGGVARWLRG